MPSVAGRPGGPPPFLSELSWGQYAYVRHRRCVKSRHACTSIHQSRLSHQAWIRLREELRAIFGSKMRWRRIGGGSFTHLWTMLLPVSNVVGSHPVVRRADPGYRCSSRDGIEGGACVGRAGVPWRLWQCESYGAFDLAWRSLSPEDPTQRQSRDGRRVASTTRGGLAWRCASDGWYLPLALAVLA